MFAARTRWGLVDKDDARDVFEESPVSAWAQNCKDGLEVLNSLAYDVMFSVAQKQLSCGNSVIVDCPLARPSLYERGRALALQVGATRREQVGCFAKRYGKIGVLAQDIAGIAMIECLPSNAQEWRRRLEARAREGNPGQSHKPQSWAAVTELRAKCVSRFPRS